MEKRLPRFHSKQVFQNVFQINLDYLKKMFINRSQFHKGFTLIETLFAILIFSSALIALMTIAGRGIAATANAEQTTTASYLAQEGIEVVRNMRDSNYNNTASWDSGFSTCTPQAPCKVQYGTGLTAPGLAPCSGVICPAVYQSPLSGFYVDQGVQNSEPTQYVRTVYVIPATPPAGGTSAPAVNEYQVVSKVMWTSKTIPHVVTLDTILKDWH